MQLLLVSLVLLIRSFTAADNLVTLVETLSRSIDARHNVFFCGATNAADISVRCEQLIQQTTLPKLIFGAARNVTLRGRISAELLAIVCLRGETHFMQQQSEQLSTALQRWRRKDVLFIAAATALSNPRHWLWLFEWCRAQGFYNVLLTADGRTLLTLASFLQQLPPKRTTLTAYLQHQRHHNGSHNFQRHVIRVAAGNHPPRALLYRDAPHAPLIFSGLVPRVLQLFAQRYNFTLQLVLMPHYEAYSVHDCFKHLAARQVDVCADLIFQDDVRYIVSRPQQLHFGYLTVPYAQHIPIWRYFFAPFASGVWLLIVATVCYVALLCACICWLQCRRWQLGKFALAAIAGVLQLPFTLRPLLGRTRAVLHVLLIALGFLLANLYVTLLSSMLSTSIYERQIETLADLRTHNVTIMINDVDRKIFEIYGVSALIRERLLEVPNEVLLQHRNALDARYAYISLYDKCELYLYQQKFMSRPRMKLLNIPVDALWGGMPMASDWAFEELFNDHLARLHELGFQRRFMDTALEEAIRMHHIQFFKTVGRVRAPLSVAYFVLPAAMLAVGYTLAVIVFAIEQCVARLRRRWDARTLSR